MDSNFRAKLLVFNLVKENRCSTCGLRKEESFTNSGLPCKTEICARGEVDATGLRSNTWSIGWVLGCPLVRGPWADNWSDGDGSGSYLPPVGSSDIADGQRHQECCFPLFEHTHVSNRTEPQTVEPHILAPPQYLCVHPAAATLPRFNHNSPPLWPFKHSVRDIAPPWGLILG